jgi:hypothetical protein
MTHGISQDDQRFRERFETFAIPAGRFDHRSHIRLAYIHLCDSDPNTAHLDIRRSLHAYLDHHGADPAKYSETITRAWVLAVHHFMAHSPDTESATEFIEANPALLDSKIMLKHYSSERLFSDLARVSFVEPDLQPIPRHGG